MFTDHYVNSNAAHKPAVASMKTVHSCYHLKSSGELYNDHS